LTVVVLSQTTVVVIKVTVDSHVRQVGSSTHAGKLAIPKFSLSYDNGGVFVFKGASRNGVVPCILCTGSAALNAAHGSAVARNRAAVLQGELIDTTSTDIILWVAS
jgi:hypothetical protein